MTTLSLRPRRQLTAIRATSLFDGAGGSSVPRPLVLVDGATIVSVEAGGEPPEGADLVDLGGVTLLPGLVDTHVHLAFDSSFDPVGRLAARTDAEATAAMRDAGAAALAGGVTTVRDLGDRHYLSLALRDTDGMPTIVAAGPPITSTGGHCHFLGGATTDVRAAVREHVERGVDVIKIMASGGVMTPGSRNELSQFRRDTLGEAVDEAHRHGLPVTAHAHGTDAIRDALEVGVDGMEHVSFWSVEGVDRPVDLMHRLADRRIVVGATLGIRPVAGAEPPAALATRLAAVRDNLRLMHEIGVPMVAGSDAGIAPVKPPDAARYAVADLVALGLTGSEALRTVTSTAAQVLGLGHRKGRVAAGYDADLLAVDGDPLTDPAAIHRIRAVFARGARVV